MKRWRIATACLALLVLSAPVEAATTALDPRDSVGPLDIRQISHARNGNRIVHTVRTQGGWRKRKLRCRSHAECRGQLQFHMTTDPERPYQRWIGVLFKDGRLQAWMQRQVESCTILYCRIESHAVEIKAWHPAPDILKVSFPRRLLGREVQRYGWRAAIVFRWYGDELRNCTKRAPSEDFYYCNDYAPNNGYLWHRL